jgi:hypothetical protein
MDKGPVVDTLTQKIAISPARRAVFGERLTPMMTGILSVKRRLSAGRDINMSSNFIIQDLISSRAGKA